MSAELTIGISASRIDGHVNAPPSKSCSQRACAAAFLNNGITEIYNFGSGNDELAALDVIKQLGAQITHDGSKLTVTSSASFAAFPDAKRIIDCGESGLSARLFASVAAVFSEPLTLTGRGSLLKRPMHFFAAVFPQLGVLLKSSSGFLPLQIAGPLRPANITIDGSQSSQYLSGLLFAFSAAAVSPVTISVTNLKSKSYADLTIEVMHHFGRTVTHTDHKKFVILPHRILSGRHVIYAVEGDWSNAAFLLVAGALSGRITVTGLRTGSTQPDKQILAVLKTCGAVVTENQNEITVSTAALRPFEFDATDCPDLFPPLAALATACAGVSKIRGVSRLSTKESDRGRSLVDIFSRMGVDIKIAGDEMIVSGGPVSGATIYSHNDHRIAMAAAVAGLTCSGTMIVNGAVAVNKSYPGFFTDLTAIGAACREIDQYI